MSKPKPIAVVINDIHYDLPTLEPADASLNQAIDKANALQVQLVVAGDLHNTKANMRAECVNRLIKTIQKCDFMPWILSGNHDRINEKSHEHALNFLSPYAHVLDHPVHLGGADKLRSYLIPYYHNPEELRTYLKTIPKGARLIMHQGIIGSNSGEYIQDKSAITKDDVAGFRVISGHYHARQDIELPDGGLWSYTGNPYTLNFGEANDPPKGFHILMDDGSLEFVPTNLRKHVVIEIEVGKEVKLPDITLEDIVKVKLKGTKEQLQSHEFSKQNIRIELGLGDFKLELIPLDTETQAPEAKQTLSQAEILDSMIDSLTNTEDKTKVRLKQLWKDLI